MSVVYRALLLAAGVAVLPLLALGALFRPKLRRGLTERLRPLPARNEPTLWLHAASVGEVEAAVPLARRLLDKRIPILATTFTTTGRDRLKALLPDIGARLAPLDLPWLARVGRARVRVLVQIETELWPEAMSAVQRSGGSVAIVSARLSDASLPGYRRFAFLFRPLLARVAAVGARSTEDGDRFEVIGVPRERISVTGDLKLDRPVPAVPQALRDVVGPGPLFVAGSTHAGEDDLVLDAWQPLREKGLRLVLVPRHPERAQAVRRLVEERGFSCRLRSETREGTPPDVLVVDTVGELAALYGLADLVFLGGSLVETGGHNLVEPVQAGRVVVHGPHVQNQRAQQALLEPLGVLHCVDDGPALSRCVEALFNDEARNAPALQAQPALAAHRGSVERTAELVSEIWARA